MYRSKCNCLCHKVGESVKHVMPCCYPDPTDEPLPCPFCGGEAHYYPSNHETRMDGKVECLVCYASIEETHSADTIYGEALFYWNRRV